MRIGRYLLAISLTFVSSAAYGQVSQKPLPGQDLNNAWTGNETHSGTETFANINGVANAGLAAGGSVGAKIDAAAASVTPNGLIFLPSTLGAGNSLVGLPDGVCSQDVRGISGPNQFGDEGSNYIKDILFRCRWTAAATANQASQTLHLHATSFAGGSNQSGGNGKTTYQSLMLTGDHHTQGQHYGLNISTSSNGLGDQAGISNAIWCSGGVNAPGDEGCKLFTGIATQPTTTFTATVTSVASNTVNYNTAVNEDERGELRYLIVTNRAMYTTGTISSISGTPPTVVGSGTGWSAGLGTGAKTNLCFSLTNGNTANSTKLVFPVASVTDDTHLVLTNSVQGSNQAWFGDSSTGNYTVYTCSQVQTLNFSGSVVVTDGTQFQAADTVEEPLAYQSTMNGITFGMNQQLPTAIAGAGFQITNQSPRTLNTVFGAVNNWSHIIRQTGQTVAALDFANFSSPSPATFVDASADAVDNSFKTIFTLGRNIAEGGTFNYTFDKSSDALAFNGAKQYNLNGFSATSLKFQVNDSTGVPRFIVNNGNNGFPTGKITQWWSDNQATQTARVDGSSGAATFNSLIVPDGGLFGSNQTNTSAACETTFGLTTLNVGGTTTDTGLNCLPANSIIDAIVYRITTTITTAANFTIGDATIATRFCAAQSTLTAGTTGICFAQADQTGTSGPRQVAATKVRVTTNVNPGAGIIRLIVFYHTWTAPSS